MTYWSKLEGGFIFLLCLLNPPYTEVTTYAYTHFPGRSTSPLKTRLVFNRPFYIIEVLPLNLTANILLPAVKFPSLKLLRQDSIQTVMNLTVHPSRDSIKSTKKDS